MKQKRPKRSKRRSDRRSDRPPPPAPVVDSAPQDTVSSSSTVRLQKSFMGALSGLSLRVCLAATLAVFLGLIFLQISLRWRADQWPAIDDVGLVPLHGAVGAGLLVVASLAAWLAARSARSGSNGRGRLCLLVAIICAGGFFSVRTMEFQSLHADGLWRRSIAGPIHERPGIYYLRAVGLRFEQLYNELEDRRIGQPDLFTDQDQLRLDVVSELERSLVSWTEHQVGHWLEDLEARRAAIKLVAHQIHPLVSNADAAALDLQEHRRELQRRRPWFELLRDYCSSKLQLLDSTAGSPVVPSTTSTEVEEANVGGETAAVAELDDQLRSKLESLGLADWPYARSVMIDAGSSAMVAERLNQIQAHLDATEARLAFLDAREEDAGRSLNCEYPWLRLPICLPGGNAWAGGFFALNGLHMLLLGFVVLLSIAIMLGRAPAAHAVVWGHVQWWWHVAGLVAVATFLLFYVR